MAGKETVICGRAVSSRRSVSGLSSNLSLPFCFLLESVMPVRGDLFKSTWQAQRWRGFRHSGGGKQSTYRHVWAAGEVGNPLEGEKVPQR